MDYLPIFVDVRARRCLVIGGGPVAARKVDLLLAAGASVEVVSPELGTTLAALRESGKLIHHARRFDPADLEGAVLAVAATGDRAVNELASCAARSRGIPVNVVDVPALCTYITPAIVDRSPVIVAASTGGAAPVLARLVRGRLEAALPPGLGRLAEFARGLRETVKSRVPESGRRGYWEALLGGPAAELVMGGREDEARAIAAALIEDADSVPAAEAYFVGAGPGAPDLLTLRALRLMQQADLALHDADVPDAVLALVRRDAEREAWAPESAAPGAVAARIAALAGDGRRLLWLTACAPGSHPAYGTVTAALDRASAPWQCVPGVPG